MTFFTTNRTIQYSAVVAVLLISITALPREAFAFYAGLTPNRASLTPLKQSSSSNEELQVDPVPSKRNSSANGAAKPFSVTPITLSIKKQPEPLKDTVNLATLGFNKKLSEMSKNVDSKTAAKAESLLFDAQAKYEKYLKTPEGKANPQPKDMIIPNTVSFTNTITAYARSNTKESPYKAQELLDKMHTLYSSGMKHVKPNRISYNSVINAWAKSKEYRSARKTEKLLWRLFDFYQEEGGDDEMLRPDARTFNSVINAGEFMMMCYAIFMYYISDCILFVSWPYTSGKK